MIKTKIFAMLGLASLITSLVFVFVGKAKIEKGEKLEEEKTKITTQYNSSEEWKELKKSLLADAEKQYKEGKMSYEEYIKFWAELENKEKIAQYAQNVQMKQIDEDIEKNEKEQQTCMGLAGAGGCIGTMMLLLYGAIDDDEIYL